MRILVTGTAGFIGHHVAERLAARGDEVTGLDVVNDYYDVELKYARLASAGFDRAAADSGKVVESRTSPNLRFVKMALQDRDAVSRLFAAGRFDRVCHLAAQAGVRYSIENPFAYVESNLVGFMSVLEAARRHGCGHFAYASSSSVYGLNESMPFATRANVDHPISLYAASKKSNELSAHVYSHLYGLPTTGLRFFTVYGPFGRPDMALFLFTKAILEGNPIDVFNMGDMKRDFTYIDDIVEGVVRVIDRPPAGDPAWDAAHPDPSGSRAPYKVYNIGNSSPVRLLDFIEAIEEALGKRAEKNLLPLQPGDVPATWADVEDLTADLGYRPATPIRDGVARFVRWYREYYKV